MEIDKLTLAAKSEKAADKSSAPTNSLFIIVSFETASDPLISICFAEASFFMFEKNLTASSRKFICRVLRAMCVCLCLLLNKDALFIDVVNPIAEIESTMKNVIRKATDEIIAPSDRDLTNDAINDILRWSKL